MKRHRLFPAVIVSVAASLMFCLSHCTQYPDAVAGVPIEGNPDRMASPYAPEAGLIDISELTSGTIVEDPFAEGKHLIVP